MKHRGILAMLLIVTAILGMFGWEAWGRQNIIYKDIIVAKKNIEKNTVISRDMLKIAKVISVPEDAVIPEDINKIIGKETSHYLPAESPIFSSFVQKQGLVPSDNQYVFAIPLEWILNIPQTLRRGDDVYMYKVKYEGTGTPSFLFKAKVVYSKDSGNNEVKSMDPKRLQGSGNVTLIEVIITKSQMEELSKVAKEDCKLLLMYR